MDEFEKTHGFLPTPKNNLEGSYIIYDDKVVAIFRCVHCRDKFDLVLHGQTEFLTREQIEKILKNKATARHDCSVLADMIESKGDRHFKDITEGMEIKREVDYKIQRGLIGKPAN